VELPWFAVARAASDLESSPSRISYAGQYEELLERPRVSESNRHYRPKVVIHGAAANSRYAAQGKRKVGSVNLR
jgi:hypothetical protein